MAENVMNSTTLTLPSQLSNEIWKQVQERAILCRLSGSEPQKFGKKEYMLLKDTPKAEIVGESEAKSGSIITYDVKEIVPLKLHTGVRVSDEFLKADAERQNIIMEDIANSIRDSFVNALDTIGFQGKNPKTNTKASQVQECIFDTVLEVECTPGKEDIAIDEAYSLVIDNNYQPNAIAASRKFDTNFRMVRDGNNYKMYPNGLEGYNGLKAATGVLDESGDILAVVGNFSSFKWGVIDDIALHVIPYGDPDNTGRDLAGHNEVFVRAEVYYAVGIMDLNAFAKVKKAD